MDWKIFNDISDNYGEKNNKECLKVKNERGN
jgi:hypothetical protein